MRAVLTEARQLGYARHGWHRKLLEQASDAASTEQPAQNQNPKLEDPIKEEFLPEATLRRLESSNREQNADGARPSATKIPALHK
jgi:hypothetical protein